MRLLVRRYRPAVEKRPLLRSTAALVLGVLAALSAACSGSVIAGPDTPDDDAPRPNGATTDGVGGGGAAPQGNSGGGGTLAFQAAPVALRKLTVRQYQNTVRDLFGADAELPKELEPDTSLNGFYSIAAAKSTVSPSAAEKFEAAAYALAAKALDATHRKDFVGCTPSSAVIDSQCTTAFVTRFGLRAFRRPLSSEEVTRYVGVAEHAQSALGDFYAGLEFAVSGLLQSPHFLFRAELADATNAATSRPYGGYEMASRLSFLLWNSTPDSALLAAAEKGELGTLPGLSAQAERLLADPRARTALDDFHSERLALDELASLDKDKAVYDGLDDTLRGAMQSDVLDTIEEFTFGTSTDFRALLTTRVAFVESKLAALYGLPATTARGRVELPESSKRAGLLGKAAFLAANAHADTTSPTKRGKYVRERLLCQSIPAPPPNVVTVLPMPNPNAPTMRDRLATHAASAACSSCHALMDPIGLSLEHFDAIGRYRADDQGHALDTTGTLDGKRYDGEGELSALLHDDPRTSECAARQLYRYAVAHVETKGEAPAIEALIEQFASSGYRFTTLLRAVIASDGFRYGALGE